MGKREPYFKANVVGTENLIKASQTSGIKRFINLSSSSVYFYYKDQFNLKVNNIPEKLSSYYAETKYLAEKIVSQANNQNMQTVSLRPRGVIGAGDENWLPRIIKLKQSRSLIQPGNGQNVVDFTSVENLIDVIEICLKCVPKKLGRTYNVTNGQPEKLWSVVTQALQLVGFDSTRRRIPKHVALPLGRLAESYHKISGTRAEPSLLPLKVGVATFSMTLDISETKELLGYEPRVSTLESLNEFAAWWTNRN